MTAAQIAREFNRLKDLQRLLRLHEREHGTPLGTACLRRDVVEHMRRLAKLMKYGAPVAVLLLAMLPSVAMARDDGRHANSPHKDWVKGLKSKASGSMGCCDISDGSPPEAVWDMGGGRYQVTIEGKSYDVPDEALISEPNRLGYAVVWYFFENGVPKIRCFMPGAGG
jgi:hypothetical protein